MDEHLSDEQLSCLIDGELSLTAREAAVAHLRGCPRCARRHDEVVETVSSLRLEPALAWREADTAQAIARIGRRRRELALPLALAAAALAAVLAAVEIEAVRAGSTIAATAFRAATSLLGGVLAGGSGRTVTMLLVLAVLAPLLSLRLARTR